MTEAEDLKGYFHQCMPLFIALGDEIRLTIVEALTEAASRHCGGDYSPENMSLHGLNVREITDCTSLSRPAVSHHLKILREAGLIDIRRSGTCNYYYLTVSEATARLTGLGRRLQSFLHMELPENV